jgi:hypothetical protein
MMQLLMMLYQFDEIIEHSSIKPPFLLHIATL